MTMTHDDFQALVDAYGDFGCSQKDLPRHVQVWEGIVSALKDHPEWASVCGSDGLCLGYLGMDDPEMYQALLQADPKMPLRPISNEVESHPVAIMATVSSPEILDMTVKACPESLYEARDAFGNTMGHHAVMHGGVKMVRQLLAFDSNIACLKNKKSATMGHYSLVITVDPEVVQAIVDAAPQAIEIPEKDGWTMESMVKIVKGEKGNVVRKIVANARKKLNAQKKAEALKPAVKI